MNVSRIAWLGAMALATSGLVASQACSTDSENGLLDGNCGNATIEGTEECDDGNTDDADACTNSCLNASCGDGVPALGAGEECDDGNGKEDDCCLNDCTINTAMSGCNALCGNGDKDPGEQCDDGGDSAMCDVDCTYVECGDGYVNAAAGETCEESELQGCDNCGVPTTSSGMGGDPCAGQQVYAGVVTNSMTPTNDANGAGILSVWSYGGQLGVQAGNDMCQIIGADHVCSYAEVLAAEAKSELSSLPDGMGFWLHRVTESVPKVLDPNQMTPPGPGARCNDWTYPTDHIADGEYGKVGSYPDDNGTAGGSVIGGVTYYFDDDSRYNGLDYAGSGPGAGGVCGANNSGMRRALLCCFPVCRDN
jgi:cysteine-rich repeat protein